MSIVAWVAHDLAKIALILTVRAWVSQRKCLYTHRGVYTGLRVRIWN